MPGVVFTAGGLATTWEFAPFVAKWLGAECPVVPVESNVGTDALFEEVKRLPGATSQNLDRLQRLRAYQVEGAVFMARRAYAMNTDAMRLGKSAQCLHAASLVGGKVLGLVPAIAKHVWGSETVKWFDQPSVVLQGRSGTEAFVFCPSCYRKGPPEDCFQGKMALPKSRRKVGYLHPIPPERIDEVISELTFVYVNYDIIVAQHETNARGGLYARQDLDGWSKKLARHKFNVAFGDEFHVCRGWTRSQVKRAASRTERVAELTSGIPHFWGITGTPLMSYPRDYCRQVDLLSEGAMTVSRSPKYRKSFPWTARYCDAGHGDHGWVDTGESDLFKSEFVQRLGAIRIGRSRKEVLPEMPTKLRDVLRLDPPKGVRLPRRPNSARDLAGLIRQTGKIKVGLVAEKLVAEALEGEGNKIIVYCFHKPTLKELHSKLSSMANSAEFRARKDRLSLDIWSASGDVSPMTRAAMAKAYVDHVGAGIFIATIDAVQVAISLLGAQSVHFLDFHWNPPAMLQAEDRPFEPGSRGLSIVYYVLRDSIDEHVEAHVKPKIEHLAEAATAAESLAMSKAFDNEAAVNQILKEAAVAYADDELVFGDEELITESDDMFE